MSGFDYSNEEPYGVRLAEEKKAMQLEGDRTYWEDMTLREKVTLANLLNGLCIRCQIFDIEVTFFSHFYCKRCADFGRLK